MIDLDAEKSFKCLTLNFNVNDTAAMRCVHKEIRQTFHLVYRLQFRNKTRVGLMASNIGRVLFKIKDPHDEKQFIFFLVSAALARIGMLTKEGMVS